MDLALPGCLTYFFHHNQRFGSIFIETGSGQKSKFGSWSRRPLNPDPDPRYFLTLPGILKNYFIILIFSRQKNSTERHTGTGNVFKSGDSTFYIFFKTPDQDSESRRPLNPDPKHRLQYCNRQPSCSAARSPEARPVSTGQHGGTAESWPVFLMYSISREILATGWGSSATILAACAAKLPPLVAVLCETMLTLCFSHLLGSAVQQFVGNVRQLEH